MSLPIVAIVGRSNVGKSTLFNRIIKKRSAIVNNVPGVTRDRMYAQADWFEKPFIVIDTGGIDLDGKNELELQVKDQCEFAIVEADTILFVVDGKQGLTPQDQEIINKIRVSGKPLFLVVNKIDDPKHDDLVNEFYRLGVEHTISTSAEHGFGVSYLMEILVKSFPSDVPEENQSSGIRVAIIGKPNVGKSSLINRIFKSKRCIVSDIPGTTRDAFDTHLEVNGEKYVLTDTAGIRRKGKTSKLLDKFSVIMALKGLERCDIAVLLIDAAEGVSDQDATIAGYALERGRACIIGVNKWDLIDKETVDLKSFETKLRNNLKFLDFAPIITLSAKTGYGLDTFFPSIQKVYRDYSKKIPTRKLNDCFAKAVEKNPMSSYRGKFLKIYYSTQVKSCPPTINCYVNYPKGIHFSYERYLINYLRKTLGFIGTPIRLSFRSRHQDP